MAKLMAVCGILVVLVLGAACGGSSEATGTAPCRDAFKKYYDIENENDGKSSYRGTEAWRETMQACSDSEDWMAVAETYRLKDLDNGQAALVGSYSSYFVSLALYNECKTFASLPQGCLPPGGTSPTSLPMTSSDCFYLYDKPGSNPWWDCKELQEKEEAERRSTSTR